MQDDQPSRAASLLLARAAVARGDALGLVECLAACPDAADHDLPEKARLLLAGDGAALEAALGPDFGKIARFALDAVRGDGVDFARRLSSDDQDYIGQLGGIDEWGVDQWITRLALERIPSATGSGAVVGTMRDDGIYILEWLAHYRAMGFSDVFVYTNDNADGSDALLDALAQAGVLTVVYNEITGAVPPEVKAFGHALNLLPTLWRHEWALFVDSDEFLVTRPGDGLSNVLSGLAVADPGQHIGGLLYDWAWFVSEMKFRREPGLLMERFQLVRDHWLGKCMVRLRDTVSMRQQHCPDLLPGKLLGDSSFNLVDTENFWDRKQPEYAGGQVNHYWPKSFEEFAIKKARGAALGGGEDNTYDRPYKKFFEWNGWQENSRREIPSRELLGAVRREIAGLRALPGVSQAQAAVEQGFRRRLGDIGTPEQLLAVYERNRVPPGPL